MNTEGLSKTQIADAQLEVEPQAPEEVVAEVVAPAPEPEPAPAPPPIPGLDDSSLYIHRELSQLQFTIRVLEQL